MSRLTRLVLITLIIAGLLAGTASAWAQTPKYLFKVASLAPDGSVWARRFQEFAREVTEKTNGEVGFKIYAGGVMGDDRAMFRKMQIGQLQGGGFTMTGIGEVVPDFRIMGIPFLFNTYEEVDYVWEKMWPRFRKAFADKKLALLAMSEVGFIYTMSTKPIASLDDLRKSKSWVPEGDPISAVFLETAGVTPISLSIPDVLTSLQTGLINTVYNSFYGAIVLQWFTRTRYITDIPFAYANGAFVLDLQAFSRLPADYAAIMEETAKTRFARLLQDTRDSNAEALQVLQKNNITLVEVKPAARAELQALRKKTEAKLINQAFSKEIFDETVQALAEYRAGQGR